MGRAGSRLASAALVALFAGPARADDHDGGLTLGVTTALGWGSRGGPTVLAALAIGKRYETFEVTFEPRLMIARYRGAGEQAAVELGVAVRWFFERRTYVDVAGGLALLEGTNGDGIPDGQPFVTLGVGREVARSGRVALDVRAVYLLEIGVQSGGEAPKSNVHSGVLGVAVRFY